MKRYYNNISISKGIASLPVLRSLHKGLVRDSFIDKLSERSYVVSGKKRQSAHIKLNRYSVNKVNIIALKSSRRNDLPVIARVVGLYKRSRKFKHRVSRRNVVMGRAVAVGTTLGYILSSSLLPRNKMLVVSRRKYKRMLKLEIGKLYVVHAHRYVKGGILYKPFYSIK